MLSNIEKERIAKKIIEISFGDIDLLKINVEEITEFNSPFIWEVLSIFRVENTDVYERKKEDFKKFMCDLKNQITMIEKIKITFFMSNPKNKKKTLRSLNC